MPVDPLIYATTDAELPPGTEATFSDDLADFLGRDRFYGPRYPVSRVYPIDYEHSLPKNLPRAQCIIEISTASPFYGKGYTRGDWPELASILEFLRHRIPTCNVWYGDDSSDEITLASHEFMADMWKFWAHNGNRPYQNRTTSAEQGAPSNR